MSKCKFCGTDIFWSKLDGRNKPFTADGDLHECDEMKNARKSMKKLPPSSLTAEEIAKYEEGINKKKK